MKRARIRTEVETHLASLGLKQGQWLWSPMTAELLIIIGNGFRKVKLKSGMSQRALMFELGRISGWFDALAEHAHAHG